MGREWRLGRLVRERYWGFVLSAFPAGRSGTDWGLMLMLGSRVSLGGHVRVGRLGG